MCTDTLKEIRKLAEIALLDVVDTIEYEYDEEDVLLTTLESARDKLREILKRVCDALDGKEQNAG